jgi:hypothetical protein
LSRIAKEGRKYGVFLGLVTQRPAEIDPTIISQCNTLFAMPNDRDQALIRSAVSDAGANLLTFIPSLGIREVFAFGSAVAIPTRLAFKELPAALRPSCEAMSSARPDCAVDGSLVATVIEPWRGSTMSHGVMYEETSEASLGDARSALQAAPSLDPQRFRTLRKPLDAALGGFAPSGQTTIRR